MPPNIAVQDFGAFALQGWVASSFGLAQTVFLLFYAQIMCIYSAKWVVVAAITFFETGPLISGVSQNAKQLIVGRTVRGMGPTGMCAYPCFFSYLVVVLTFEMRNPNSRLHDTDHYANYQSPGSPKTLWRIRRSLSSRLSSARSSAVGSQTM